MFRNTLKTFVLLASLAGLTVAIDSLFGRGGAVIGLGLGLAIVRFSYWKSDTPRHPRRPCTTGEREPVPGVLRHGARAHRPYRDADATAVHIPRGAAQRVRHRAQPEQRSGGHH
jgi:hypothetical protein